MVLELPHSSGLCGSAGVTAGIASLAACSTEGADTLVRPYKTRHWGLESLPHITSLAPHKEPGAQGEGGWRWNSRALRDCVALPA
jgi:hypothetical protein